MVIHGRASEQAAIELVLARARVGEAAALLLAGEPGIGKTALVDHARAAAVGIQVLEVRGIEREAGLPFSALADLLRPVLARRRRIPSVQAAALGAATALDQSSGVEPFTVFAATLSLVAAAANDGPLLILVDDLHWIDEPSREALLFAVRRLRAESIASIITARPDGLRGSTDGLDVLTVSGLDERAASELLVERSGHPVTPAVVRRLHVATAGNPLALVELARTLSGGQLSGRKSLPDPLPVGRLEEHFGQAVAEYPAPVRAMLLVVAASDTGRASEIEAALEILQVDSASLATAVRAGLVQRRDDLLGLSHPLLRSAVYRAAPDEQRRAAHRALAAVVVGTASEERRAWHQAAGTAGPDAAAADALAAAGHSARARGGHETAALAFARSATLTSEREGRAERLLQAAASYELAGDPATALDCVDRALTDAPSPALSAELTIAQGRLLAFTHTSAEACRLLFSVAQRSAEQDRARAAIMMSNAATLCATTGEIAKTLEYANRGVEYAKGAGESVEVIALTAALHARSLAGEVGPARELAWALVPRLDETTAFLTRIALAQAAIWLELHDLAGALLDEMIAAGRARSLPAALPYSLAMRSELDLRLGRWGAARAEAAEALELSQHTGQLMFVPFALVCLARIDAVQGRAEECLVHATEALERSAQLGLDSLRHYAAAALGMLELGLGRGAEAASELSRIEAVGHALGFPAPNVVQWLPDRVEAHLRAGRHAEANDALELFTRLAAGDPGSWTNATLLRCRALLAAEPDYDDMFARAAALHDTPFERARTQLCWAKRLRRSDRASDAHAHLQAALTTFEWLDARPWAAQARKELMAVDASAARTAARPATAALTAQELRVALTVAAGATNREAATALFLSPKTIEFHLANTYRKLGIRSRTQLARRLDDMIAPST